MKSLDDLTRTIEEAFFIEGEPITYAQARKLACESICGPITVGD